MAVHHIDRVHLKVALSALLILTILTLISIARDEPSCWPPSHFTGTQVLYTRQACRKDITRALNKGYPFPLLSLHVIAEVIITLAVYLMTAHINSYACLTSPFVETAWKQAINGRLVAPSARKHINELLNTHGMAVLYFLSQTVGLIAWIGASISSMHSLTETPNLGKNWEVFSLNKHNNNDTSLNGQASNGVYFCEVHVRRLGNVQRYGLQCELPTYDTLKLAIAANQALCFIMAASILVHLIHTFAVSPQSQKSSVSALMQATGESVRKLGLAYGFTNLHMVTFLRPEIPVVAKLEEYRGSEEVEAIENRKNLYPYVASHEGAN